MDRIVSTSTTTRRTGAAAAVVLAVASLLLAPTAALAVTPIDAVPVTLFPVAIDTAAGDQYDPHVSGDLVSYTSDTTVRSYDFFSGSDDVVPTSSDSKDELSDTSNGKVTFARLDLTTFNQTVQVFDEASQTVGEVDPQSVPYRSEPAIGSDTVAFIDAAGGTGELVATRLGGVTQHVTSDTRIDQRPAVAPSGDLVVYESCAQSPSNCDIRQAAWNGTAWVVTSLTSNADPEANPDTDGSMVVYDAFRGVQRDICWQPAGGGSEQCLVLSGEQRDPSIAGGVILYEDAATDGNADLFAYEIASNRRFRITSTQGLDETLNDITRLTDGRLHLVWSSGSAPDRNVYGATIELPPTGPTYHFGGFRQPVDARPTLNQMKAGAAVPVKFSLGGDQGLSIFAAGYPKSQVIACGATADVDGIEQTVNAGGSSMTYDPSTDTYDYVWKTDKTWAGTCRQLVLAFADGSVQRADFKFK